MEVLLDSGLVTNKLWTRRVDKDWGQGLWTRAFERCVMGYTGSSSCYICSSSGYMGSSSAIPVLQTCSW